MSESFSGNLPIKVISTQINRSAVSVDVSVIGVDEPMIVSPELAKTVLQQYPDLANHACKSGQNGRFGQSIVGALLPHLVEHLAIELLVQADRSVGVASRAYAGNTNWLNDDKTTMRIRVSYYDAQATKMAIDRAVELVNVLLGR